MTTSYNEFVSSKTYVNNTEYCNTPIYQYNEYYYIEILESNEFMLSLENSSEINDDITILEHKLYQFYKEENQ